MILTPVPPRTWVPLFWGGGVSKRIVAGVCVLGPGSYRTVFYYMDPLTHGGGQGSHLQVPPYIWENATYPSILGFFGPIRVPYLKGLLV